MRDGNIYARGACDDKGQMYMHIKAIEALRAVHGGTLPLNVKFLIEGEEEVGGESIARVRRARIRPKAESRRGAGFGHRAFRRRHSDAVHRLARVDLYGDGGHGPARDLHSGMYGGAAPNAVYGLIELLAKAKDANGRDSNSGHLRRAWTAPAAAEIESWKRLPFTEREFLKEVGSTALTGEPDQSVLERVWARPTFEVHGIAGGFTGPGAKTVIPAKATAKVSFRLVPRQDPEQMVAAFANGSKKNTPKGIQNRSAGA